MIGQMPQDQFQQLMGMMNEGGVPGGGMGGMAGMPPGAGAGAGGGNVIRLSEEEGAAVGRLTELGFDRTDAAQVRGSRGRGVVVARPHPSPNVSHHLWIVPFAQLTRCQVQALKLTPLLRPTGVQSRPLLFFCLANLAEVLIGVFF